MQRTCDADHDASVPAPAATASDAPTRPAGPCDRLVRQVQAVDAWNTARQARELLLTAHCVSRLDRQDVERQQLSMRRTQSAIMRSATRELAAQPGPTCVPAATAVVALRRGRLAGNLCSLRRHRGITVVACTDDGTDALGAVIAEQPDVVLIGERLTTSPAGALLVQCRTFAPATVRAVRAGHPSLPERWRTHADLVFPWHDAAGEIADALTLQCRAPAVELGDDLAHEPSGSSLPATPCPTTEPVT